MHKDYNAERAVELALGLNRQQIDSGGSSKEVDALLEDAGKIKAFINGQ